MSETPSPACESIACELKGGLYPLTTLRLLQNDLAQIGEELDALIAKAPGFLLGAPLVLDTGLLQAYPTPEGLVSCLRERGLVPVGAVADDADFQAGILQQGLALLTRPEVRSPKPPASVPAAPDSVQSESEKPESPSQDAPVIESEDDTKGVAERLTASPAARVITAPVRSGQQIYARGSDLIVLSNVNTEAEVAADGHVHVYGRLLGRAIAGAAGDESARIFASHMDPQLLSIAGVFKAIDEPDTRWQGKAAQGFLNGEQLNIQGL